MKHEVFGELLKARLAKIEAVLGTKAREYASCADRLHNFARAAKISGESRGQVCIGFFLKHLVSVLDIVDADANRVCHEDAVLDEKIGDAINYLILLEAILKDRQ